MASVAKRKWTHNGVQKEAWIVRYQHRGRRLGKQFDLKKDADAFKRQMEREQTDGTHIARETSLTITQVSEHYLRDAERRWQRGEIAETTYRDLVRMMKNHMVPNVGDILFKDIAARDVDDFYERLCSTLTPVGARKVLGYLASMEKFAIRHGYMLTSPVMAALAGIRRPKKNRIREFTLDETVTVMKASRIRDKGQDARAAASLACFVHLAGCCGLRIGEICALKVENIDLDRGRVMIRHSLNRFMEITPPKTAAGVRDVPLPRHLREMIADWQTVYFNPNDDGLMFTTRKGEKLNSTNFLKSWHRLLIRCGLDRPGDEFHFHALRHFAGSWWLHNAMPIADVSKLLGHASPAVTLQIYAHVISTDDERHGAVESMGHKLSLLADARVPQIA